MKSSEGGSFSSFVSSSYMCVCVCVSYSSGMQQINEQIRQRLVEKHLQEEMKENEKQQFRENQERMNLEDLKVQTLEETIHINRLILLFLYLYILYISSRPWRRSGRSRSSCTRR